MSHTMYIAWNHSSSIERLVYSEPCQISKMEK